MARPLASGWRSRGYLPHFDSAQIIQHIVFRLADALPASVLEQFETAESALDAGHGCRALADSRIAALVQSALLHFHTERYHLMAWCVMPTHVHVLVAQIPSWPLASVVHAWKSFTANRANRIFGRQGRFWAPEYFDRMMRDEEHVDLTIAYVENNPVAAGLCTVAEDWPWGSAFKKRNSGLEARAPAGKFFAPLLS